MSPAAGNPLGTPARTAHHRGVVFNFSTPSGTGVWAVVQDMSELEIFGKGAAKSEQVRPDPLPSARYWGKYRGKKSTRPPEGEAISGAYGKEVVELRGIEPLTSSLRTTRSPI